MYFSCLRTQGYFFRSETPLWTQGSALEAVPCLYFVPRPWFGSGSRKNKHVYFRCSRSMLTRLCKPFKFYHIPLAWMPNATDGWLGLRFATVLACYGTNMETRRSDLGAGPLKQENPTYTGSQKSRISSLVVGPRQRNLVPACATLTGHKLLESNYQFNQRVTF